MRSPRRIPGALGTALSVAVLASGVGAPSQALGSPFVSKARAGNDLLLDGHGYGHGIGLSQWGAYGYAADFGWSATQILDHYYGGTVSATTDATSITVRLQLLDNQQTSVVHDRTQLIVEGISGGPWASVVARETAERSYTVWARSEATLCPTAGDALASGWTIVATGLGSVTVGTQTDTSASADFADLVGVCEPSGKVRSYRGTIRAVNGTDNENRTVNQVPLEQYLRPLVASEMSASWATRGSAALQAQAVAARSYALAENRYSYAKTCDQVCQFYPGAAWRSSLSAGYTRVEQPSVDVAVRATAAVVRRVGSASGAIAYTMFSASSGGYTAASTLPFPAVPDLGDATSGNPNHSWQATVSASTISGLWPSIGAFSGISIVARSGDGEWGGRVTSMVVSGSSGSVTITGDVFRSRLGLKSNWFNPRGVAGSGQNPPPQPVGCGGRDAPAIGAALPPAPPALFQPSVPRRLIDTRDGTGTTTQPLVGGCTLVIDPDVADGTTAVDVNIVTVVPSSQGFITAYPCGIGRPFASAVQSQVGQIVSGSAVVPLGADGTFCVFSNVTTEVVVDMTGSYSPSAPARFEPIVAQRRFDSRTSGGPLAAGTVVRVNTRGLGAGAADSSAAAITIHALDAAYGGFVTAWPCDTERPWASSANVAAHSNVTNYAEVAVSSSGEVCLFVSAAMDLAVDVNGWFGATASTEFHAVTPFRLADTREGQGWSGAFARNVDRSINVAGVSGLPSAATLKSVAAQFTAVNGTRAGYLTVHPCLTPAPSLSMLRYATSTNVAVLVNSVLSPTGAWCVVTNGSADLVIDVSGWFG